MFSDQLKSEEMWTPQKFDVIHSLYEFPIYEEKNRLCLPGHPKIHHDLFGLGSSEPGCCPNTNLSGAGFLLSRGSNYYSRRDLPWCLVEWMAIQSCVQRVKSAGTQPSDVPVVRIKVEDVQSQIFTT